MREKINEKVSVISVFSAARRRFVPHLVSWQNKDYIIGIIGFHHTIKRGEVLHHIFECTDKQNTIWFRLDFDTKLLHWTLEAVADYD